MALLPDLSLRSPVKVRFVPSDRFFMRVVPLAAELPAAQQAELALESLAPFPPAQLYWGCWVAPGGQAAVVYAAHRRRFTAEETADWSQADLVVPDVLPLLGAATSQAGIHLRTAGNAVAGAAWRAGDAHPAAVLARDFGVAVGPDERRVFAAELAQRAGIKENPPVVAYGGEPRGKRDGKVIGFEVGAAEGPVARTTMDAAAAELLDVRDRVFLAERRRQRRGADVVWRVLVGGLVLATGALLFELGALGLAQARRIQEKANAVRAPHVAKLESMHGLASRLEDLASNRLRFFEMLDAINRPRPTSILFTQVATTSRTALEIQAQTAAAGDIATYEASLRKLAGIASVETRDLRAREGTTTFGLVVSFKPGEPREVAP